MNALIALYIITSLVIASAIVRDEINMNGEKNKIKLTWLFVSSAIIWPFAAIHGVYDGIKKGFKSRNGGVE